MKEFSQGDVVRYQGRLYFIDSSSKRYYNHEVIKAHYSIVPLGVKQNLEREENEKAGQLYYSSMIGVDSGKEFDFISRYEDEN